MFIHQFKLNFGTKHSTVAIDKDFKLIYEHVFYAFVVDCQSQFILNKS